MTEDSTEDRVRAAFLEQAELCEAYGSAFTADLLRVIEANLGRDSATGAAILGWRGDPRARGDALALRMAAGLHALVLTGKTPSLTTLHARDSDAGERRFERAVVEAMAAHDAYLLTWLERPPQTNEVGRSAAFYLGLRWLVKSYGLDLALLEIGASAGLNLIPDEYGYDFGGLRCGKHDSKIQIRPRWSGPQPASAPEPRIVSRKGCDLTPISVEDPDARLRLKAYVWPDQVQRLNTLEAALEAAAGRVPPLAAADAPGWIGETLAPAPGVLTVMTHSLTTCYLSPEDKDALERAVRAAGERATPQAPLATLGLEMDEDATIRLRVTTWPDRTETVLAESHPHCQWIKNLRA